MEHEARPTDGHPENALNCEAMIPKAKATAGEPIRTPVHLWRGVSVVSSSVHARRKGIGVSLFSCSTEAGDLIRQQDADNEEKKAQG